MPAPRERELPVEPRRATFSKLNTRSGGNAMGGQNVKLFLSCVSDEFGAERKALRHELRPDRRRRDPGGFHCARRRHAREARRLYPPVRRRRAFRRRHTRCPPRPAVLNAFLAHAPALAAQLAAAGFTPNALARLTYTQWEAWLAIHYRKPLIIAKPTEVPMTGGRPATGSAQTDHLQRLRAFGGYPVEFASRDQFGQGRLQVAVR